MRQFQLSYSPLPPPLLLPLLLLRLKIVLRNPSAMARLLSPLSAQSPGDIGVHLSEMSSQFYAVF